jgi:hypothetical protein
MSNGDGQGRDVVKAPSTVPVGPLGGVAAIDHPSLTDEERAALIKDHAKGLIEIDKKAREIQVDAGGLKSTLGTLAQTAKDVSESGNAVTMTHTMETKLGRTEVKIGNTEEAKSGKLTSTQTGERNWTPYYIFAGIAALILIAFLFAGRH